MASLKIQAAVEADLPAILELYAEFDQDPQVMPLDQVHALFQHLRAYPDYTICVALQNDEIVGTFALLIADNLAHRGAPLGLVENVVVRPDRRRRGIGREMMQYALERCRARGCYKLCLSSNLKREEAHRFYESLGFRRHGYSFMTVLQEEDGG